MAAFFIPSLGTRRGFCVSEAANLAAFSRFGGQSIS